MDSKNIYGDEIKGDKVDGDKVGRDKVVNIYNLSDTDKRNLRIRQHLLDQLQLIWIDAILENNIHEVGRHDLGLTSQPDAVQPPWTMSLELPNQPTQTLPPTSKILDTYQELGGAMLILGDPGSGKTTTLIELARELRHLALVDLQQPVPLVFNLASWSQKRPPLLHWLVEELFLVYGVGRKQAREYLQTMPLHLLLDGLDEVAAAHQDACVTTINHFRSEHGPVNVVVCSRTHDYQQLSNQLQLMGTVRIQPLTPTQINAFLAATSQHLVQLVNNDEALQELAQAPLTLNIITLAYRDHPPTDFAAGSIEERRRHLFTAYIDRMFERRGPVGEVDKRQSINYLAWLAAHMRQNAQSVFYIENMQPTWLGRHKRLYQGVTGLIFGLSFGLLGMLIFGMIFGMIGVLFDVLFGGLIGGLVGVLFGGLSGGLLSRRSNIVLTETLTWSRKNGQFFGLSFGLFFGLSFGLFFGLSGVVVFGLLGVLTFGPLGLLFSGLLVGLSGKELQMKSVPNQGITRSGHNALSIGLLVGLFFGLFVGLLGGQIFGLLSGQIFGLLGGQFFGLLGGLFVGPLVGLLVGLIGGLRFGGEAFIQHFVLRGFLAQYNYLPFKLVPFLDDMANRILLRKVGGGYIYIHRMLLDYFADLEKSTT